MGLQPEKESSERKDLCSQEKSRTPQQGEGCRKSETSKETMTRIDFISIQTLCHATENEDKVLEAVKKVYPSFTRRTVRGHFGNPIIIFEARIKRKKEIVPCFQILKEKVGADLKKDLKRRVDEKGNIYIRLDKQELYQGNYILKDSGEVKIIIHIKYYPVKGRDAGYYAAEILGH